MKLMSVFAGAVVASAVGPAQAQLVPMTFILDGLQETPPNASPASGFGSLTLNVATGEITLFSGSFSGLVAPATAAHIHQAPPGTPGGVIVPLVVSGGTSGTLSLAGVVFLNPAQVSAMLAGNTYVNVHDSVFPGGEIRGQIIPAPATLGLMGIAGLAATRRRR